MPFESYPSGVLSSVSSYSPGVSFSITMAELVVESNVPITFLGFAPLASLVKVNLAPASFSPFSSVLTIWRRS